MHEPSVNMRRSDGRMLMWLVMMMLSRCALLILRDGSSRRSRRERQLKVLSPRGDVVQSGRCVND